MRLGVKGMKSFLSLLLLPLSLTSHALPPLGIKRYFGLFLPSLILLLFFMKSPQPPRYKQLIQKASFILFDILTRFSPFLQELMFTEVSKATVKLYWRLEVSLRQWLEFFTISSREDTRGRSRNLQFEAISMQEPDNGIFQNICISMTCFCWLGQAG